MLVIFDFANQHDVVASFDALLHRARKTGAGTGYDQRAELVAVPVDLREALRALAYLVARTFIAFICRNG